MLQNSFCMVSSLKERDQLIRQDYGLKTPSKTPDNWTLTRKLESLNKEHIAWAGGKKLLGNRTKNRKMNKKK